MLKCETKEAYETWAYDQIFSSYNQLCLEVSNKQSLLLKQIFFFWIIDNILIYFIPIQKQIEKGSKNDEIYSNYILNFFLKLKEKNVKFVTVLRLLLTFNNHC